jgi:diguanylate cyclase
MISIRSEMKESERLVARFQALLKAFLGLAAALPKTAVPASPEASSQYKEILDRLTAPLKGDPEIGEIDEAGKGAVERIEEISSANKAVLAEFDATMKEVASTVAAAIGAFKGHGERHNSSLTKLADGFESLARVEDIAEIRRRLHADVAKLRQAVELMRRESEESSQKFESRISAFEQRLEIARKGSDTDRLTNLGSRRIAERHMQQMQRHSGPIGILLFDIEGFRSINERHGPLFGDQVLQVVAGTLRDKFPEEGSLFRWGADEFLVIAEGSLLQRADLFRGICDSFANTAYTTYVSGVKQRVAMQVAWGAAQYSPGESVEGLYRRARENLELNRRSMRP